MTFELRLPAGSPARANQTEGMLERLTSSMALLSSGCELDMVTPLCRPDRSCVVDDVWDTLKLGQLPMYLREVEQHQRGKIGSHSLRRKSDKTLAASVESAFSLDMSTPCVATLNAASAAVFRRLQNHDLTAKLTGARTRMLQEAQEARDGKTGLGWPYCSSKVEWLPNALRYAVTLLNRITGMRRMGGAEAEFPYLLGTRGSPVGQGRDPKWRAIFQGPWVVGLIEKAEVQMPLFDIWQNDPTFAAWKGRRAVDRKITSMMERHQWMLSIDFANFDATVPSCVIARVFELFKNQFTWENGVRKHRVLDYLRRHFTHGDLITPTAYRSGREKGIPSGSVLTNLVGSIANLIVVEYGARRLGFTVSDATVQGDDGVFVFRNNYGHDQMDIKALSQVLSEELGMTLHVDKQFYSQNEVHYLQNVHRRSYTEAGLCVGVRPVMRILNGMLSYDRYRSGWNGYMDTIRWWQQLENGSNHPNFTELCAWVLKHDRNSGLTFEELCRRAGGIGHVEQVLGGKREWDNKVPLAQLPQSWTAMTMAGLIARMRSL